MDSTHYPHGCGSSHSRSLHAHLQAEAANAGALSLTVIPSRRRGDEGNLDMLVMVLHKNEHGRVSVSQQLRLVKATDGSEAALTGLLSGPEMSQPLRSVSWPLVPPILGLSDVEEGT